MRKLALALVHYPVVDRQGDVVTTAITNLDLHDIARTAYTYGVDAFYVVHPVAAQRALAARVRSHWVDGSGARRIPDRKPPMSRLRIVAKLEDVQSEVEGPCELWATSAQLRGDALAHEQARAMTPVGSGTLVLLFGTGWGLAPSILEAADHVLAPIRSARSDAYNHLSVRAAAAILLDRLMGHEHR